MGEVVNLKQFRKAKERKEAESKAEANRLAFGRTKAERDTTKAERERDARRLEGHKLDDPENTSPDATSHE